ncbi:MAG: choice-of-anchor tandem repeat GloVer-containing protein [Candidatus Tumulicola sp.]
MLFSIALFTACGGARNDLPSTASMSTATLEAAQRPFTQESTIYEFKGAPDGGNPYAGLLAGNNGEFYGTTNAGGAKGPSGLVDGTVYEVSSTGTERVLYSFQGGSDGAGTEAGVIAGQNGVLLGVTDYGGGATACTGGCGTVYALTPSGSNYTERVLYPFGGGSDGAIPLGTLVMDKSGALYGTTNSGGTGCTGTPSGVTGCGTVFKLTPAGSGYTEKVLYKFKGGNDGAFPKAALIADSSGALYGTTQFGGGTSGCSTSPSGDTSCGIAFKVTASGHETVIYRFQGGTNDGGNPRSALLAGKNGALFGATVFYGSSTACGSSGCGTVFELARAKKGYTEKVIYNFGSISKDAARPDDPNGLYADASGDLFGTASLNLAPKCACGAVFELTPSGSGYTETVLHDFTGTSNGARLTGSITADSSGTLYGTTFTGGKKVKSCGGGCGVVFKVAP